MRQSSLTLFAIAVLTCSSTAADPVQIRVLSYNIHHGEGIDNKLDLDRIAAVILEVKPDIVALQEVDQDVARTGGVDQPAVLARLTRMHVAFGANIDLQGGHYGNAILSRFPIMRHQNHLLPNIDNGEQRGVLAAEIPLPETNQRIRLLATHLDHRPDERERLASAKKINELALQSPELPTLLAGDLNATPDSQTLRELEATWQIANTTPLPTIPVQQPTRQIDYILFRPAEHWKVVEAKVLKEAIASDHRPILTVLEQRQPQD